MIVCKCMVCKLEFNNNPGRQTFCQMHCHGVNVWSSNAEETENTAEGDQAQEIAVMTRSSIVANEEIEEWKTA